MFIGMDSAPEAFKLLDRLSGPGVSNQIYRVRTEDCIHAYGVWVLTCKGL